MEMVSRQNLITAKYPKNLLYMVMQFDMGYDIFEILPIEESVLIQNIEKAFCEIRYCSGNDKLTHINRSIQIAMMYFKDEISINQISRTFNISRNKVENHINFVLIKLRNPIYWHVIIYGELGSVSHNNTELSLSNNGSTNDVNDDTISEMDFSIANKYIRAKKYPKSLYYDIFGFGIDYDAYTYITPEDSVIQKNIEIALKEFKKNNPYSDDHDMVQYLMMYYKDGMSLEEIATAVKKTPYTIDIAVYHINRAIRRIIKILRTPRYSYILCHGETNPDYIDIENSICSLNLDTHIRKLHHNNIFTIDALISRSKEDLLALHGVGPACVKRIEEELSTIGLRLNMDKACKKYAYKTEDIDMLDKLIYELDYEDACKLILDIRTRNSKY